jgi:hypothetical protein
MPGSAASAKRISAERECEPVFFITAARWFSTGLVDANDGDSSLRSPLMSVGDGRAKEHLIQVFLLRRVDYLGDLQPLGKKAYAPINLA